MLDKIRQSNVQEIVTTQQIETALFSRETLCDQTQALQAFDIRLPGLLIMDTPGHKSFCNLRHSCDTTARTPLTSATPLSCPHNAGPEAPRSVTLPSW